MSEHDKKDDSQNILRSIQDERTSDVDHEEILAELPDSNEQSDESEELTDVEDKSEQDSKGKSRKKVKQVKVPQANKKTSTKKVGLALAVVLVAGLGYVFYTLIQPVKPGVSSSIPSFFGKTYTESNNADTPVTSSQLNAAIQQLRLDVFSRLETLPTDSDLTAIKQSIREIENIQSAQQEKIVLLNQMADRPLSTPINNDNYDRQFSVIKQELDALNAYTGNLLSTTEKLKKDVTAIDNVKKQVTELTNSNWATYLEVQKLKKLSESDAQNESVDVTTKTSKAKKVTRNNVHSWVLKIASERFTQIYNTSTGKNIRVFEGVEIPNCGVVTSIDVASRKVITQHCSISRK